MTPSTLKTLDRELTIYLESLTKQMGRPERRLAMPHYVTGRAAAVRVAGNLAAVAGWRAEEHRADRGAVGRPGA